MKALQKSIIGLGSIGLIFLAACGNETRATNSSNTNSAVATANPATSSSTTTATTTTTTQPKSEASAKTNHPQTSQGGQVIESGLYHLELVPISEANGTHIDFFLQKGDTHEAISDAKVTAQIQVPSGEQKTLDLDYDAAGKHYAGFLPEKATGEYKVVMLTDIKGEKTNGRFAFNR